MAAMICLVSSDIFRGANNAAVGAPYPSATASKTVRARDSESSGKVEGRLGMLCVYDMKYMGSVTPAVTSCAMMLTSVGLGEI